MTVGSLKIHDYMTFFGWQVLIPILGMTQINILHPTIIFLHTKPFEKLICKNSYIVFSRLLQPVVLCLWKLLPPCCYTRFSTKYLHEDQEASYNLYGTSWRTCSLFSRLMVEIACHGLIRAIMHMFHSIKSKTIIHF